MKVLISLMLVAGFMTFGVSQNTEFKVYPNGLIYSDSTMNQLEYIVDSLNLKFLSCDLYKTYYSKYQARVNYLELSSGDIEQALVDIRNKISYEEFVRKHIAATVEKDLLAVKYRYKNYKEEEVVLFSTYPTSHEIHITDDPGSYDRPVKGKWVFDHYEGSKYAPERIKAFYFITGFEKYPMDEKYARLVMYSDCLVDTTAQIFTERALAKGREYSYSPDTTVVQLFIAYVNSKTGEPEFDYNSQSSWENYREWRDRKPGLVDSILAPTAEFHERLQAAIDDALENGGSTDEFEEYVARYVSPDTALELKRGRKVMGNCSQDLSPRIHAMNIAVLSAETVKWEIFLRSHLDIMNDRFERTTDGSYAWKSRKTYIRELEELDINVTDLLLGIALRIENPAENHYFGNISRLGRALSESADLSNTESTILQMIKDDKLDDFNRLMMTYLFLHYNYNLEDESRRKQNLETLELALEHLPEYLTSGLRVE